MCSVRCSGERVFPAPKYQVRLVLQVETWPLVKAHGLEQFGGQGFFTMTHPVTGLDLNGPPLLHFHTRRLSAT